MEVILEVCSHGMKNSTWRHLFSEFTFEAACLSAKVFNNNLGIKCCNFRKLTFLYFFVWSIYNINWHISWTLIPVDDLVSFVVKNTGFSFQGERKNLLKDYYLLLVSSLIFG